LKISDATPGSLYLSYQTVGLLDRV